MTNFHLTLCTIAKIHFSNEMNDDLINRQDFIFIGTFCTPINVKFNNFLILLIYSSSCFLYIKSMNLKKVKTCSHGKELFYIFETSLLSTC